MFILTLQFSRKKKKQTNYSISPFSGVMGGEWVKKLHCQFKLTGKSENFYPKCHIPSEDDVSAVEHKVDYFSFE